MKPSPSWYVSFGRIAVFTLLFLLVPLVGTLTNTQWSWGAADFLLAGALLFSTGLALEYAKRNIHKPHYLLMAYATLVGVFVLIWAELAVGILN